MSKLAGRIAYIFQTSAPIPKTVPVKDKPTSTKKDTIDQSKNQQKQPLQTPLNPQPNDLRHHHHLHHLVPHGAPPHLQQMDGHSTIQITANNLCQNSRLSLHLRIHRNNGWWFDLNGLNVAYLNVNRVMCKLDLFKLCIEQQKIYIFGMGEAFLDFHIDDNTLYVHNYFLERRGGIGK